MIGAIPYPRYVTAECVVLPKAREYARAEVDGILKEVFVEEGDRVHPGQIIARLDEREIEGATLAAKAEIERQAANLLKLRNGSRPEEKARAEAVRRQQIQDLRFARVEAARQEKLVAQGVGSQQDRDFAAKQLELSNAALARAEAELRLVQVGFRSEEIAAAEAELHRAEVELAYLEKKRVHYTIRATIEGIVVTPKLRERLHMKLDAGATVCELASTDRARVEILVPEREMDVVAIGQPAVVKVHAHPLHPFRGEVSLIGRAVEEKDGLRLVRVTTEVDNRVAERDGVLAEAMTGYGEVDTGTAPIAVLVTRRLVRWIRVRFLV